MLSVNERHQIILRLSMVNHPSIWGYAIQKFNARASGASDHELFVLVRDLQSQIDDNPAAMKEILGDQFEYIDRFRRDVDLNIQNNIKELLQKAVRRYKTRNEQATALGITQPTLLQYLTNHNVITAQ